MTQHTQERRTSYNTNAEHRAMADFYLGGPYHDGTYSICEIATGRVRHVFNPATDDHHVEGDKYNSRGVNTRNGTPTVAGEPEHLPPCFACNGTGRDLGVDHASPNAPASSALDSSASGESTSGQVHSGDALGAAPSAEGSAVVKADVKASLMCCRNAGVTAVAVEPEPQPWNLAARRGMPPTSGV